MLVVHFRRTTIACCSAGKALVARGLMVTPLVAKKRPFSLDFDAASWRKPVGRPPHIGGCNTSSSGGDLQKELILRQATRTYVVPGPRSDWGICGGRCAGVVCGVRCAVLCAFDCLPSCVQCGVTCGDGCGCGESEAENDDPAKMTDSKMDFLGRQQRC